MVWPLENLISAVRLVDYLIWSQIDAQRQDCCVFFQTSIRSNRSWFWWVKSKHNISKRIAVHYHHQLTIWWQHDCSSLTGFSSQLFTMLIILDISSHWCQMYFTASFKQHHKSTEGNLNSFALVRWYYSYYYFFGYCCVGTEFTYVAIYILARLNALNQYETIRIGCEYFLMIAIPACITKQIVNVSQLCSACHAVAMHDAAQKNK